MGIRRVQDDQREKIVVSNFSAASGGYIGKCKNSAKDEFYKKMKRILETEEFIPLNVS